MRALTTEQPVAYLAGVLLGDAWLSSAGKRAHGNLSLRVADEDFAFAFASAITAGFAVSATAKTDERGYWLVRRYNGFDRFAPLVGFEPATGAERAAWLLGLFDSEGNAQLTQSKAGEFSWDRRVAFYSTESTTLDRAAAYLGEAGLPTVLTSIKPSAGHKGTRPVYQLRLRAGQDRYRRFGKLVGSNIARKQRRIDAMVASYVADRSAACRAAQLRGAAVRKARRDSGGTY